MPSIIYDFIGNTDKLDKALESSTKKVKEFDGEVTKSATIEKQIALVKQLEEELSKLWNKNKARGQYAPYDADLEKQISNARAKRDEAAIELKRMQEEEVTGNAEVVKSEGLVAGSLGKWAVALAVVTGAITVIKKAIMSTEGTMSKFEEVVGFLKGGFEGLYRTIATGKWEELIRNIKDAAKATKEAKEQTSELEHIIAGGTINRADFEAGLQRAREAAAGTTNATEKKKFLEEAKGFQKQITDLNVSERKATLAIDEEYYFKLTGHSKEYYDYLLTRIPIIAKNYATLYSQQEANQIRLNQLNFLETRQKGGLTKAQEKERHDLRMLLFTLEDYKVLQEDLSKKGQWDKYIEGVGGLHAAIAQGEQALVGLERQSTAVDKQVESGTENILRLKNEIKELKAESVEIGTDFTDKAMNQELRILQAKYEEDLLQYKDKEEEKKLITEKYAIERLNIIKKYYTDIAEVGRINALTILDEAVSRGASGPNVIGGTNKTLSLTERWKLRPSSLGKGETAGSLKDQKNNQKAITEDTREELELRTQIVYAAGDLVMQLGQVAGLSEEGMRLMGGTLDAITEMSQIAAEKEISGELLKGRDLVGVITGALSVLMSMIPTEAERFALQMEILNNLISEQQRLLELSERKGGKSSAIKDLMAIRKEEKELAKEQVRLAEFNLKDKEGFMFGMGIGVNKAKKQLEEAKQAAIEAGYAIDDLQQEYDDFIRGGITENSIADVIAQGFQDGKTSVDDFAGYMNQVLIDAVMNVFKDSLLSSPRMAEYMEWLKSMMVGGVTEEEKKENARRIAQLAAENKATYEAMTSGLDMGGDTAATNNGLLMGIKRDITEETGTELAGLFRRFADDNRATKDYTLSGLNHLVGIEKNTADTVTQLQLAVVELKSIVTNTKQAAVGTL